MAPSVQIDGRTLLSAAVANDANFQQKFWSRKIKVDARNRNPFSLFMGAEKSGQPISEKTDLKAAGGDTVTFTTTADIGGRGRFGEQSLKDHVNEFEFGTYQLQVDKRQFAIGWQHLLKYLKMRGNDMSPEQLADTLSTRWWASMERDDIMHVLLRIAYFETSGRNIIRAQGKASQADLTLADTLSTYEIEQAQVRMQAQGATPMQVRKDQFTGASIPRYLVFTPAKGGYTLDDDPKWREVVSRGGAQGVQNPYFTGEMVPWRNMLVYSCEVIDDTSDGRRQNALEPIAYLGKPIADENELTITGGGSKNATGAKTNVALHDYFANFPGYFWNVRNVEVAPTDTKTYYAILYNMLDGKYEGISYNAGAINGNTIDGDGSGTVTREVASILGTTHARYSNVHNTATGDVLIIPCTINGVPFMRSLVLGADALNIGKGAFDAERIEMNDGFTPVGSPHDATDKARGIHGIRGYQSPRDTDGRANGFLVIEHAYDVPGVALVDMQ